jgi:hypothetical protein
MLRLFWVAAIVAALAMQPGEAFAFACNNNYYVNVSGHSFTRRRARPSPATTRRTGDGSESFSEHHQGTCSHHGGVDHWD